MSDWERLISWEWVPEYAVCHDEPHRDGAQIKERFIRQGTVLDKVFRAGAGSGWLQHLKRVVIGRSLTPNLSNEMLAKPKPSVFHLIVQTDVEQR
jgi:hypothetical protein